MSAAITASDPLNLVILKVLSSLVLCCNGTCLNTIVLMSSYKRQTQNWNGQITSVL